MADAFRDDDLLMGQRRQVRGGHIEQQDRVRQGRGGRGPRRFHLKRLELLQDKEPGETLLELVNTENGLIETLSDGSMGGKMIRMMLRALSKACECEASPSQLIRLLAMLKDSRFLNEIVLQYLTLLTTNVVAGRIEEFEQPIKDIIRILNELLSRMPTTTSMVGLQSILKFTVEHLEENSSIFDEDIAQGLKEIEELANKQIIQTRKRKNVLEEHTNHDLAVPPDNFREIPIFPRIGDLNNEELPFLRPSKTKGKYQDVDHFLDVQFRLLREDFVYPLRQGISEYLQAVDKGGKLQKKIHELRIYNHVNILCPVCTNNGLLYRLRFSVEMLSRVNWKRTKRLIFGSLVCLSSDNFRTLYFATVGNRDLKMLEQGIIDVAFQHDQEEISHIATNTKFIMAETTAYFEAYRHVLSGLQNMRENDLPFKKYIVSCDNHVDPPSYLRQEQDIRYDLRPLVDENVVIRGDSRLDTIGDVIRNTEEYEFSKLSEMAKSVDIENIQSWPSKDLLHLDERQWHALLSALTREFSITQGPPGTGKTYIGLKIVKALLHNHKIWNTNTEGEEDHRPMLVVCFTNHALDQFLEGIVQFFRGDVIRVGGRSMSEAMKKYNLQSYRMKFRSEKEIPIAIHRAKVNARNEMKTSEDEINNISGKIETAKMEILHEDVLKPFMDELYNELVSQFEVMLLSFNEVHGQRRRSAIIEWLELGMFEQYPPAVVQNVQNIHEQPRVEGAQLIDIIDDVAAIEAQREIDDDNEDSDDSNTDDEYDDDNINIFGDNVVPILKLKITANDIALNVSKIDQMADCQNPYMWQMTNKQKKNMKRHIRKQLISDDCMTADEAKSLNYYVWDLTIENRWRLYRYWIQCLCERLRLEVRDMENEFQQAAERYRDVLFQEDREILRHATVIGMTTTCAARYQAVLQEISPRIIVIEEAAEVLEAHIITTLSRECKHLILIGDHQQLKPNPTVYKLARDYNLEISLFERMINNDFKLETLDLQHRMRPEIANVMRHIYSNLKDHAIVQEYEHIRGISTDMFFIDHGFFEKFDEDGMSHSNEHEAKFVVALCRYFLLQGYDPEQITILTTYSGQLYTIKTLMPMVMFEGVCVTTVDNYQGEENDIVILSLVRSNEDGNVGFVKTENRICVALSRAKKGLYVIGNFTLLESQSDLWRTIIRDMRKKQLIGGELRLHCQNHPNDVGIIVKGLEDFKKAPEGGCLKPCGIRLPCGHVCTKVCHIIDPNHQDYKCKKPCAKKICKKGHTCQKRCYEKCDKCELPTAKIIPRCGHRQNVPCDVSPEDFPCQASCRTTLACGHICRASCGYPHTAFCQADIRKNWTCGHTMTIKCCDKESALCPTRCNVMLKCNDPCIGTCGECLQGKVHVSCSSICQKILVCGHQCMDRCANNACPPCRRQCQNKCAHSKCQKECGELCAPCNEPCVWSCQHYTCKKKCSEPCERPRCNSSCEKYLPCGHKCCGLCGEPCPSKCRICHRDELTKIFFGFEDEPHPRYVELKECRHVFESSGLDKYMDDGVEDGSIQMRTCPLCKTSVRKSQRYGNIIKKILLDIERVKCKVLGKEERIRQLLKDLQKHMKTDLNDADLRWISKRFSYPNKEIKSERLLTTVTNTVWFLKKLKRLKNLSTSLNDQSFKDPYNKITEDLSQLERCIRRERRYFTDQETEEMKDEMLRISYELKFFSHKKVIKERSLEPTRGLESTLMKVETILIQGLKLSENQKKSVKECLITLREFAPCSNLGISDEDRFDIITAMGLKKGHWFKCKNGHIYAIGECGGATVEATCPECNEQIGGQQHRLRADNSLATEMDGATAAAWPTAFD